MEDEDPQRDELIKKRLAEMQKMQAAESQLRSILRVALEPAAYERLMNVRIAKPELYAQIARVIVTLYSNKQLAEKVTEEQLRALLGKLTEKHEGTFEIKRK